MKDFLRKTIWGMFSQTQVVDKWEPTTALQEWVADKVAVWLWGDFSGHHPFIQRHLMARRQDETNQSPKDNEKTGITAGLLNKNCIEILDISLDKSMSDTDYLKRIDELIDELIVDIKGPISWEKGLERLWHFKQLRKMGIFVVFQNIEVSMRLRGMSIKEIALQLVAIKERHNLNSDDIFKFYWWGY